MYTTAFDILIPEIQANIRAQKNVFTGAWHSRQNASATVTSKGEAELRVGGFGVPYGLNLELGAPPHNADPTRILAWVVRKLGVPPGKAKAVAAQVLKSIATKGTRPHPSIGPVWAANSARFFKVVVARMKANIAAGVYT
jgi:hypothetical protein